LVKTIKPCPQAGAGLYAFQGKTQTALPDSGFKNIFQNKFFFQPSGWSYFQ
jgi:hypothetical protein